MMTPNIEALKNIDIRTVDPTILERVAIYIRLSNEDRDSGRIMEEEHSMEESYSIINQRNYIRYYLTLHKEFQNAKIIEFVDDGYSGMNFNRPGVQEMLEQCRKGLIDCIIVKDLSRFGRNYLEVGNYLEQLFPSMGIRFIGINDGYDSKEYTGRTAGIEAAFRNFIYEMYSRDLSGKIKSGIDVCMSRGTYYTGCIVYGYRKTADGKGIEIDEDAAAVVKRIFREITEGKKAGMLAKELNQEGVLTRLAYKQLKGEQLNRDYNNNLWNHNKIHSIIHDEVYKGDMVYRKTSRTQVGNKKKIKQPVDKRLVFEGHHEAIVSKELFAQANACIRKGKAAKYDRTRVNRGIVFCGCCGYRMELRKTRKPYYLCKKNGLLEENACNDNRIEKEILMDVLLKIWQEHCIMFQEQSLESCCAMTIDKCKRRKSLLEKKLGGLQGKKMRLYEQCLEAGVGKEEYCDKKYDLETEAAKLQTQLDTLSEEIGRKQEKVKYLCSEKRLADFFDITSGANDFLGNMIKKIIIFPDNRMEVEWNYEDGFITNYSAQS